jgi:hypothetical protein
MSTGLQSDGMATATVFAEGMECVFADEALFVECLLSDLDPIICELAR